MSKIMKIVDVAFFTNSSYARFDAEKIETRAPIQNPVIIADELSIEKMPNKIWKNVAKHCTPYGYIKAARQFTQLYAFVRTKREEVDPITKRSWDDDEKLQIFIGLSRIAYPTSISFKYSARLFYEGNRPIEIKIGPIYGFGSDVWLFKEDYYDWLTEENTREISELVQAYFANRAELSKRVKQALWYFEYAYRTEFFDIRWPLICMGLESLIHTDRNKSTQQFTKRVLRISEQVGVFGLSEKNTEDVYKKRSELVHGQLLSDFDSYHQELYEKSEAILRLAIKKAILEPSFNEIFKTDEMIRENYLI